jgi:uncharacterized short protein YbdD (DUF466 family)
MYAKVIGFLGDFWRGIRTVSGDDAYERYLQHHALEHAGTGTPSRGGYHEHYQQQKWSGVNRCC